MIIKMRVLIPRDSSLSLPEQGMARYQMTVRARAKKKTRNVPTPMTPNIRVGGLTIRIRSSERAPGTVQAPDAEARADIVERNVRFRDRFQICARL